METRDEWVLCVREAFTDPEMLNRDLSIRSEYFLPSQEEFEFFLLEQRLELSVWNKKNKAALLQGIETHGIGNWAKIRKDFFGSETVFNDASLQLRAKYWLKRENLDEYERVLWRASHREILKEKELNEQFAKDNNLTNSDGLLEFPEDEAALWTKRIKENRKKKLGKKGSAGFEPLL